MGRPTRRRNEELTARRARVMAHLRFRAVMFLTPLVVVLVVVLYFTAPLWGN